MSNFFDFFTKNYKTLISQFTAATSVNSEDVIPIIQDNTNKKTSISSLSSVLEGEITISESQVTGLVSDLASAYSAGGTDVALADGGTGASLADPDADRIMFWDDSASAVTWLTAGTGLTITDTTLTANVPLLSVCTSSLTSIDSTLTSIPGMTVALLASTTYRVKVHVLASAESLLTDAGPNLRVSFSSTPTSRQYSVKNLHIDASEILTWIDSSFVTTGTSSMFSQIQNHVPTGVDKFIIEVDAVVVTNAACTLTVAGAQIIGDGTNTIFLVGSYIEAVKTN